MNFDIDETKYDYLRHFIEEGGYAIRINPSSGFGTSITPEEEMCIIMYIQECMPYLEVYHNDQWDEATIRKVDNIPIEDRLFFYKRELTDVRNHYNNILYNIQRALND